MRAHRLRLNPVKCTFGVRSGNFLRFLVSQSGIEMAHGQVQAIGQMQPPITNKHIHAFTGKLAALSKFISRYLDRLRLFFAALKGASSKGWGPECDKAF